MRLTISLLSTLVLILLPRPVTTHAEEADAAQIKRLVQQLGSEEFSEREAASRALERIGEPALAALREAATGSPDPEVRWRAEHLMEILSRRRLVRSFGPTDAKVYSVAFSPDGKVLASGGQDHTIKLWDMATGKQADR